ncbi:MAG: tryptophan--tRNA ligase [Bdellovibrionota bacterium]
MSKPSKISKTILSGIQPSSKLTLGNYLGALKNWVKLQQDYDCLFVAVDLHAITVRQDPKELREQTYRAIATYIAAGVNHEKAAVFVQSHVPQHAELAWILNCHAYMGELSRMTQFKDKSTKQGANIPAGLFSYPVLMAADILLYKTDLVPIGADQKQHLELARDIAVRMNNLYSKDLFTVPEAYIPPVGAKIMSLKDPTVKMSKSDPDPNSAVYLTDSNDQIVKKIKRAVTDSGTEVTYEDQKLGVKNLINIQSAITGKNIQDILKSYEGKQYGHLKNDTADIVVHAISPIRDKTDELVSEKSFLDAVLKKGAHIAVKRAQPTLTQVFDLIGFVQCHTECP